jgi:hypothetical protein
MGIEAMSDKHGRVIGAGATLVARRLGLHWCQAHQCFWQMASVVVLARLPPPEDYCLVSMVGVIMGIDVGVDGGFFPGIRASKMPTGPRTLHYGEDSGATVQLNAF